MSWAKILWTTLVLTGGMIAAGSALAAESTLEKVEAELSQVAHESAGANSAADPLSVDPDLAIWTFVVFIVLLIVLKKFAWGPILQGLETREHNIAENIAAAERRHDEAKAMLAEYERKLASAAEQVKAMIDEANRDAEHVKTQILAEAKTAADAERNRALRDVEAATDAALKSIAQQSANLAVELAGKIVGSKLTPADHNRLISEAVTQFPKNGPSRN